MKRWQSKSEKKLIGGLLLLLAVTTLHWNNSSNLESGSANLSTTKKPEVTEIAEDDDLFKPVDSSQKEDEEGNDSSESSKTSSKKNVRDKKKVTVTDEEEETDDSSIRRQFEVGNKVLEATYEVDEDDDSKTLVTLAPRNGLESDCKECRTYQVDHPLNEGNLKNIKTINLAIKKTIAAEKKKHTKVSVASNDRRHVRIEDDEDTKKDQDPIKKACDSKRGNDSFTLCAMKELGRLANITGDDAYDASELQDLFEKHIFRGLQNQLKDKKSPSRQDDAKIAISNLIEKLDETNGDGLRSVLTKMKQIPLMVEANELASLERKSRDVSKSNPALAMRLLGEFNMRRWNFDRTLTEDMYDTAMSYESLVGDSLSREHAMSQFYENFVDPISPYHDALWSNDPFSSLRGIQGQNNFGTGQNFANRGIRGGNGQSAFPPFGTNGTFQRPGFNNRGLPPGNGTNSRFVPPVNNNGGFNSAGIPSRFGQPTTNPIANPMGFGPNRFGAPNVLAPYNQSTANYGRPYGFSSPGYMGLNQPGVRPPVLNGNNYYSGYANPYGNPFAYRANPNGAFSYQATAPNGAFYNPAMPYGTPGMSAARPRF